MIMKQKAVTKCTLHSNKEKHILSYWSTAWECNQHRHHSMVTSWAAAVWSLKTPNCKRWCAANSKHVKLHLTFCDVPTKIGKMIGYIHNMSLQNLLEVCKTYGLWMIPEEFIRPLTTNFSLKFQNNSGKYNIWISVLFVYNVVQCNFSHVDDASLLCIISQMLQQLWKNWMTRQSHQHSRDRKLAYYVVTLWNFAIEKHPLLSLIKLFGQCIMMQQDISIFRCHLVKLCHWQQWLL